MKHHSAADSSSVTNTGDTPLVVLTDYVVEAGKR